MQEQQRDIAESLAGGRPDRAMLSDGVYEPIKRLIMDHIVLPGDRVGIDFLARQLGVSPTPVREALARLEAEGLVTKEPLKGYRATELLTADEISSLFEMRALIEPWSAGHAARRASGDERRAIELELEKGLEVPVGERYDDYQTLTVHDQRFHQLIADASGNAFVASAFRSMHVHLHLFRLHYGRELGATVPVEHSKIAAAIVAGDADAAAEAMSEHIMASRKRIAAVFDRSD